MQQIIRFLVELAAKIAVSTVNRFLQENPYSFDLVEWVLFDAHTEAVHEAEWIEYMYWMMFSVKNYVSQLQVDCRDKECIGSNTFAKLARRCIIILMKKFTKITAV